MKRRRIVVFVTGALLTSAIVGACIPRMPCREGIRTWAQDEVTAHAVGNYFGNSTTWTVEFDVKNVVGKEDGWYEVEIPSASIDGQGKARTDGRLALSPPLVLTLQRSKQYGWDLPVADVTLNAELSSIPKDFGRGDPKSYPSGVMRLGARVEKDADRNFTVNVYAEDRIAQRWVLLGTIPAGKGTQSSLRKVGEVLLIVPAWIGDGVLVVTSPIWLFVGSFFGLRM